jgi:dolichol-phosphate mannosyltransferase
MTLSIIIPAHNEESFIEQTIKKVYELNIPYEKEVIVINDGSNDKTEEILNNIWHKYKFKIVKNSKNLGKGASIKNGLELITGKFLIIQDADGEYDPEDIPSLLKHMSNEIGAIYGDRGTKKWPKRGYHYVLGAKILTVFINLIYGSKLKDVYTGYKLFNLNKIDLNLLKNLKSTGFEFEAEVTCKILKNKNIIIEIPINYIPRNKEEGKHIGFKDAIIGFWTILKNI